MSGERDFPGSAGREHYALAARWEKNGGSVGFGAGDSSNGRNLRSGLFKKSDIVQPASKQRAERKWIK